MALRLFLGRNGTRAGERTALTPEAPVAHPRAERESASAPLNEEDVFGGPARRAPRWMGEYVRDPNAPVDPVAMPKLIEGITRGIQGHYAAWLRAYEPDAPLDVEAYKAMLRRVHLTICEGGYGGHTTGSRAPIRPGKFRSDAAGDPKPPSFRLARSRIDGRLAVSKVRISGVPEHAWPRNEVSYFDQQGTRTRYRAINHYYPRQTDHHFYFARMASLDGQLRAAVHEGMPAAQVVPLLAEYYRTAANCPAFRSVNNSLWMGQVNEVLHTLGLNGISHGNLDFLAFTQHPGEFGRIFQAAVRERNPGLAAAG